MQSFQGSEGRWTSKSHLKLAKKEKRQLFFREWGEAKFMFMLVRMCGVCLDFHSNQLGIEVPLDFFFLERGV